MVGDPVQNDVKPLRMCGVDKGTKIVLGAEFRVHAEIVFDGVRAAQAAFAILLANRMNGHQPENVDAERLEARQLLCGGVERAFRCELAGVDLIDDGVFRPFRML